MNRRMLAATALLSALGACRSAHHPEVTRAVWVTRFDYRTSDDVKRIVGNCAQIGFNTVLFQVRGNGTAFYRSSFEPWADELGGRDPGFDPLQVAIDAAHARGLSLHAWVNVMPSWRGATPPSDPDQLFLARPEWHWFDRLGRRQPLVDGFYVSLNPCLPEVREYLVRVLGEIVERYDVDGLHLDYIRFVDELLEPGFDPPRDGRTLWLYREETGLAPDDDPDAWKRFKARSVTRLVEQLRERVREANPEAWLSAAVGAAPEGPLERHERDSRAWFERGLVDAVFPMNYTDDPGLFRERARAWLGVSGPGRVVTGVRIPLDRDLAIVDEQLRTVLERSPHVCLFAYSELFATGPESPDEAEARKRLRALVRRHLARGTGPVAATEPFDRPRAGGA